MPLNWNFPAKIGPKTGKQVNSISSTSVGADPEQDVDARVAMASSERGNQGQAAANQWVRASRKGCLTSLRRHQVSRIAQLARRDHSRFLTDISPSRIVCRIVCEGLTAGE